MKLGRTSFRIGFSVLFFGLGIANALATLPPPSTQEIFSRTDAHFERVKTLSFKVDRSLERGLQTQKEEWEVFLQKPDVMRVEYAGPPRRILLSKANFYSEYIPAGKQALEMDMAKLSTAERQRIQGALMPRVAIPGFRVGISEKMTENMHFRVVRQEIFNGRPSFFIQGRDKKGSEAASGKQAAASSPEKVDKKRGGEMKIWIDRERFTLLKMEIYDQGSFVSSIESKGHREFQKGLWLPSRVMVQNNTPDAFEKSTYALSRMLVNEAISPQLFETNYEAGVRVVGPGNIAKAK